MGVETDPLRLRYEIDSREVEIDDDAASLTGALSGYLTEEVAREGQPRPYRACLLLPGAAGWRHPPTRRLADRLAVFCSCMVLIPDLLRTAEPWPAQQPLSGKGYAAWLATLPPQRVASDVRTSTIFLRADHRVGPVALFGAGLGGGHALEAIASPSTYVAAAVLCPSACPQLSVASAPLLSIFDCGGQQDVAAAAATEELAAFSKREEAKADAERILDLEVVATPEADTAAAAAGGAPSTRSARVPSR